MRASAFRLVAFVLTAVPLAHAPIAYAAPPSAPAPAPASESAPAPAPESAPAPASAPAPESAFDSSQSLLDSVFDEGGEPPPLVLAPPSTVGRKRSPTLHLGDQVDYFTRRFEPAGFPLIGGDSDIGFEFGGVGTLSYFADGVKPYRWNMDLLLAASIKQGPTGPEIAQTNFLWQLDAPDVLGPGKRLNPEVAYSRTINYGYFGLGNASSGVTPASNPNPDRYHEWVDSIAQVRSGLRVALRGPIAALFAAQYLYVGPTAYASSLLASDAAMTKSNGSPYIYGTSGLSLPSVAGGFLYDSRDDEVFPTRGMLHEVGVRAEMGFPTSGEVRYLEAGTILRGYVPLVGPIVAAARLVANFQIGNVPFYDLFQAGPFDQKEMLGGSAGIRGVPVGRYLGPIKLLGNIELRAMVVQFTVLRQKFTLGTDAFFDTGRVWSDYTFHSPLDGSGVGLKYGVGGGLYILWGQAAMLRIEAAYSPDAVSENPSLPLGIYVNDNVMF